jgi:alpha-glucuronidase
VPTDEDGYRLWLRYELVTDGARLAEYRAALGGVLLDVATPSPTLLAAERELLGGLAGLLGEPVRAHHVPDFERPFVAIGTPRDSRFIAALGLSGFSELGTEGFLIEQASFDGTRCLVVAANEDLGVLYGVFHLLRQLQMHRALEGVALRSAPKLALRMLNHWDNLDRTVERGYAGCSNIWTTRARTLRWASTRSCSRT